jgi:acetylornithine aminotransferase
MTLAKPLAGGLPIGAAIMTQAVADAMAPGDHGSTFAGNPLVCAAAEAVFDIVADPAFLKAVVARGDQLRASLKAATAGVSCVKEVRGLGLITGVQLDRPAGPVVAACRSSGLLVLTAGAGDVVRIVPPLTVSEGEVEEGVATLAAALRAL